MKKDWILRFHNVKVMKKVVIPLSLILVAAIYIVVTSLRDYDIKEPSFQKRSGTAIIMTGAAARIPQEAALLEELFNRGLMENVVFISGVSSGALNAMALNGILSGKMTWDEYKNILFSIKNSDIFIQDRKKLPVNTDPERQLLTGIAEKRLGFYKIGDLPFTTEISITDLKDLNIKAKVYRMCSRKINQESDPSLGIVDILMASTSFPVVFPKVRIGNAKTIPDVAYVDGGVGDDHIPYHALLEYEKFRGEGVERVFIISRKSDSIPSVSEELGVLGINDRKIFDDLGVSLDNIMKKGFIKRLKDFTVEAPSLVPLTYVWIPDFQQDFLMFNFDKLRDQYDLTAAWAKSHDPVPVQKYLDMHYNKTKL